MDTQSEIPREWIDREMRGPLLASARRYPVVTLLGPRQSGKTTLVRTVFPDHAYCNMEDPEARSLAASDPKEFLHRHGPPLILDEVQRVPELLSLVQVIVDQDASAKGMFILTGSHQPRFKESISQSLAGRTSIHKLLPLSLAELASAGIPTLGWSTAACRGFTGTGCPPMNFTATTTRRISSATSASSSSCAICRRSSFS